MLCAFCTMLTRSTVDADVHAAVTVHDGEALCLVHFLERVDAFDESPTRAEDDYPMADL